MDNTIADMYYIQLPTGGPTQGDIWSDLPSGNDTNQVCNGLIITPRCDFTHSKSSVLNYLPIISLEEYLISVACFPHIEHVIDEIRDGLRGKADALNVDHLFELGIPIEEIRKEVELSTSTLPRSKQFEKAKADLEAGHEKMKEMAILLTMPRVTLYQLKLIFTKKRLLHIQRDLVKNNNADTYFLPPCTGLLELPSLVLLRHIYTCPIDIVGQSRNAKTEISASSKSGLPPERLLRLNSPFIESLMSKFAALFTRVGTRDIPDDAVQTFILSETPART